MLELQFQIKRTASTLLKIGNYKKKKKKDISNNFGKMGPYYI